MRALLEKTFSYPFIRFLFSGGTTAIIHIGTVYILSHVFSVWYLYATITGFLCAVGFSFVMQKFFTFRNMDMQAIRIQLFLFSFIAVMNFIANGALMFYFVEYINLIPIVAQLTTSVIIAVWSYLVYGRLFRIQEESLEKDRK